MLILCSVFFIIGCSKEKSKNKDKQQLEQLLKKIRTLAESSQCGSDIQFQTLPIGQKACGGPSSYVAYTKTINVKELEKLIANYNQLEKRYNSKWQIASDCAFVSGPRSVNCNNGKLEVVY